MNLLHQKITLDVNNKSTVTLNAHQGDSGTRFIDVTLTENGQVIPLSSTFIATVKASLYGMLMGVNRCELDTEENKIVVELTEPMLSTPGMLNCEITLTEGEQIVTTHNFTVEVQESVVNGSTEIAENTDLAKLQRVIFLVGELSKVEDLDDLMQSKEDNENKLTTGSPSVSEVWYPSLAYLRKYNYTKIEADTLLSGKAEKSAVDNNTFDLSMLMSSLKRTATGTSIVNLISTAENGILKVTSNGNVTVKNQNMFEDILTDNIKKTNCNVSYDDSTGAYTVEYTGDGTNSFSFGNIRGNGSTYYANCGKKLRYNKNLCVRINCEKTVNSGCYITFYNSNGVVLDTTNKGTNTTFKIKDVEGADFFTMKIGFDSNNGTFATGDIIHFSVQLEYGDTVSDFVVPMSNTENLSYGGITNVVGDGDITVEYVPDFARICESL